MFWGRQRPHCGHVMHETCVIEMRRRGASGRCPFCRERHHKASRGASACKEASASRMYASPMTTASHCSIAYFNQFPSVDRCAAVRPRTAVRQCAAETLEGVPRRRRPLIKPKYRADVENTDGHGSELVARSGKHTECTSTASASRGTTGTRGLLVARIPQLLTSIN